MKTVASCEAKLARAQLALVAFDGSDQIQDKKKEDQ